MTDVYGVFFEDSYNTYLEAAFDREDDAIDLAERTNEERLHTPRWVDTIDRGEVDFTALSNGFVQPVTTTAR